MGAHADGGGGGERGEGGLVDVADGGLGVVKLGDEVDRCCCHCCVVGELSDACLVVVLLLPAPFPWKSMMASRRKVLKFDVEEKR